MQAPQKTEVTPNRSSILNIALFGVLVGGIVSLAFHLHTHEKRIDALEEKWTARNEESINNEEDVVLEENVEEEEEEDKKDEETVQEKQELEQIEEEKEEEGEEEEGPP